MCYSCHLAFGTTLCQRMHSAECSQLLHNTGDVQRFFTNPESPLVFSGIKYLIAACLKLYLQMFTAVFNWLEQYQQHPPVG